jgi:hypothetical protein
MAKFQQRRNHRGREEGRRGRGEEGKRGRGEEGKRGG